MIILWGISSPAGLSQNQSGKPASAKKFSHGTPCPKGCKTCTAAVDKALKYLSRQVQSGQLKKIQDVIVPSLVGLAFMAEGSTPTEGSYAKEVAACRDVVLRFLDAERADRGNGNWTLAFALAFLGEIYAKVSEESTKTLLKGLVRDLEQSQEKDGGWAHGVQPASEYRSLNAATTFCLTALIHAKKIGIEVSGPVIKKGISYMEQCTLEGYTGDEVSYNGSIGYNKEHSKVIHLPGGGTTFFTPSPALTAMGIHAVLLNGSNKSKAPYKQWIDYLRRDLKKTLYWAHGSFHWCFLYTAIGSYSLGGADWRNFKKEWLDWLLSTQNDEGISQYIPDDTPDLSVRSKGYNWEDKSTQGPNSVLNDTYRTATLAIILQIPLDNLVIVTGKPGKEK